MIDIGVIINNLFDSLAKETRLFMEQTYNHPCNLNFRKHPNANAKANVLANLHYLTPVELSSVNKGIKASYHKDSKSNELFTLFSPCQVYFRIDKGESSLQKLICIYYLINQNIKPIIYLENSLLVINCSLINANEAMNSDFNSLISKIIDGGEDTVKKAINQINQRIPAFNNEVDNYALAICT